MFRFYHWLSNIFTSIVQLVFDVFLFFMAYLETREFITTEADIGLLKRLGWSTYNSWRFPVVCYYHKELHMMLQRFLIRLWYIGMLADWFVGVLLVHGDFEKLTRPLDHKRVFLNFDAFYFIFNCATVDLD